MRIFSRPSAGFSSVSFHFCSVILSVGLSHHEPGSRGVFAALLTSHTERARYCVEEQTERDFPV
ncbi:hypothetical protein RB213_008148 [Colletotrichum asianum]